MKTLILLIAVLTFSFSGIAQQPAYTKKYFAVGDYPGEFKPLVPAKDGMLRTYLPNQQPPIWDVDDNNTTHVRGGQKAVICIEGNIKGGKREGIFTASVIDSFDHSKRYKIWEQTYKNDKLNGEWRTFNLRGTVVQVQNYLNDSLHGIARTYWIDGKSIMNEKEYLDGSNKYIEREYRNGKVSAETTFANGAPNGEAKKYYASGVVMDKVVLKNGRPDGLRVFYYESGKPWVEEIYNNGKHWTIIANYDSKGNKRNAGTLKDGNGTIILYDDDTTIRETVTYVNGERQN